MFIRKYSNKFAGISALLSLAFSLAVAESALARRHVVTLPAGSVDGLQDAIAEAGPRGKVIVESGMHWESSTVTIDIPVSVVGESGAIIAGATTPNADDFAPDFIDPVFHILDTRGARIEGLTIQPAQEPFGNTAVLIQDAPNTKIRNNTIVDHEYGVINNGGNRAVIGGNSIHDSVLFGVLNIRGEHVRIVGNELVRPGFVGIWLSDRKGLCMFNRVTESLQIGVMLCKWPDGDAVLPDGSSEGAPISATRWLVAFNDSSNHPVFGYLLTDGANNNLLLNNAASDNGVADIWLASEINEPPVMQPTSFENLIILGFYQDLEVLDFGVDNVIK